MVHPKAIMIQNLLLIPLRKEVNSFIFPTFQSFKQVVSFNLLQGHSGIFHPGYTKKLSLDVHDDISFDIYLILHHFNLCKGTSSLEYILNVCVKTFSYTLKKTRI